LYGFAKFYSRGKEGDIPANGPSIKKVFVERGGKNEWGGKGGKGGEKIKKID